MTIFRMLRIALIFVSICIFTIVTSAKAADPTFVGKLAMALEDSVAAELELTDEVRAKLKQVVYERERQAMQMALSLKGAPAQEKATQLEAFVAESEKEGLPLLSEEQIKKLEQISIRTKGLASTSDPEVAEQLKLADWQQTQIEAIRRRAGEEGTIEREIRALLSPSQRAKWEAIAGLTHPTEPIEVAPPEREAPQPVDSMVAQNPQSPSDQMAPQSGETLLKFSFRYQPWSDVLDWFAEQADLSLIMEGPPAGTFNYTDGQSYTVSEAIDVLNSILLTKGYTLVKREKMLIVVNLEDGIPPNLVTTVAISELDKRGTYELVSCLFNLDKMSAEEAEAEISKLTGPQGSVVALTKSQQVFVTETAGRLRTIRDMIEAVENPYGKEVNVVELENAMAEDALIVVRQLLGMGADNNESEDGSVRFATDAGGKKIFITGKTEVVDRVQKMIEQVDAQTTDFAGDVNDQLQLEVYALGTLDPATSLQVMQTLLAGKPDVRLATDENTGNLIVLASVSDHATVKATLDQMQRDSKQVEVIRLSYVDPQVAVLSISKLFGAAGETPNPNAPIIDADPINLQLLVRGTTDQIDQIKDLLRKMGEDPDAQTAAYADRGNIRTIPLSRTSSSKILDELEMLWPTVSSSRIRIVRPSQQPNDTPSTRFRMPSADEDQPGENAPRSDNSEVYHQRTWNAPVQYVQFGERTPMTSPPVVDSATAPETQSPSDSDKSPTVKKDSEIVIMTGPAGLIIASDDPAALDQLESLIETLSARYSSNTEYTVYYLKYVKADIAAQMLQTILTGSSGTTDSGGDGGLFGDLASSMLGGGGGLMGSLMGMGDSGGLSLSGGAMSIIPDMRLNALVVEASYEDLEKIDQLLKIMDQPHSPEDVETKRKPRMIPVFNTVAQDIASIVQQVYSDRIASGQSQQQRQPSPEDFIRALRGGGRGGRDGGGGGDVKSEAEKMTIGVDTRSNSLVVSAPDPLFEEVEALVEELDQAGSESNQTMRVLQVRSSAPETIQKAISTLTGQSVTVGTTSGGSSTSRNSGENSQPSADDVRRRMEMFQRMREQFQGGGDRQQGGRGGGDQGGGRGGRGGGGRGGR